MTDDEAFIRTIVASPGDDTPRLVYADWLEERGDERGAYLRHELLWARAKHRDAERRLRVMTKGLDAVWISRVSRPPIGICCDHIRFAGRVAATSQDDVDKFELQFGINLPPQYRAFLLNYNGGWPTPKMTNRRKRPVCQRVSDFHSLLASNSRSQSSLSAKVKTYWFHYRELTDNCDFSDQWLRGFLPIASPASEYGRDVFIGISSRFAGRIFEFDYLLDLEPTAMIKIASSLGHFLIGLTFSNEKAVRHN